MTCRTEPIKGASRLDPVGEDQPANSSTIVPPNYLTADGRSIPAPYWFAKAGVGAKVTPPASLGTMLFDPANSERGTLGLNLYPFLSPRVFGTIHQGNDTAKRCDLFRTGPTRSGTPIDASVGVPTVLSTNVTSLSGAAGQGDVRRGRRSPAGVRGPAGPRWLRPLRHDVHHGGRAPQHDHLAGVTPTSPQTR